MNINPEYYLRAPALCGVVGAVLFLAIGVCFKNLKALLVSAFIIFWGLGIVTSAIIILEKTSP